jgi:hypothetical protein
VPLSAPVSQCPAAVGSIGSTSPRSLSYGLANDTRCASIAPVNARGQVAFYATVLDAPAREGIFLADGGHVTKVAVFGDAVPGGGTLAEFTAHPLPSLNAAGRVAFGS